MDLEKSHTGGAGETWASGGAVTGAKGCFFLREDICGVPCDCTCQFDHDILF